MPSVSAWSFALAMLLTSAPFSPRSEIPAAVHAQRYCMGTMFDIVAYHPSRADAERAVENAMAEIFRLDGVMSSFRADSDLSRLNREGRDGFIAVDRSLYDVIQESLTVSRRSGGTFDVTIAPLLRTWKAAQAAGRRPSTEEIAAARACVGYGQIETSAPDRVRFKSGCAEIDLGGIGKGYAVDRAIAVLRSAGIQAALINGGGSSIGTIGAPPGREGWPVQIGPASANRTLLLRDRTLSTSQQNLVALPFAPGAFGDIVDPHSGVPADSRITIGVVAGSATLGDALSTTLVILTAPDGTRLLEQFGDVSAVWLSEAGELTHVYGHSTWLPNRTGPPNQPPLKLRRSAGALAKAEGGRHR
jgi:thiamine biosynthesis lipoprotein